MPKKIDLTGQTFGHLKVLGLSPNLYHHSSKVWECKCTNCNTLVQLPTGVLTSGQRRSCGAKECRYFRSTISRAKRSKLQNADIQKNFGRVKIGAFPDSERALILYEYINGLDFGEICETYGIQLQSLQEFITNRRDTLNTIHELHLLKSKERMPFIAHRIDTALRTRFTNEELLKLLSEDNATELTPNELVYGWTYFQTGNNDIALKESGFSDCLKGSTNATNALLGMYLREKPNILTYLDQLRAEQLGNTFIDKSVVQQELINQIRQLKEIISVDGGSGNSRTQLLKCVELLGKTIGAFTENVNVTEISPSDAIDKLIELTKQDVQLLPPGTPCELIYEQKE